MRQTVGGAQSVVAPVRSSWLSRAAALNGAWLITRMVAPAFQGAKNDDHACFAQPGEETLQ